MDVEVVLLPSHLAGRSLTEYTVIVFDVLRATTTITSGFAAGIRSFRAFADLDDAKAATKATSPRPILIGELNALPAPGVDLGNSPRQWTPAHAGRDVFMATTNGTKAITAARSASQMFVAALVNAKAAAYAAAATKRPILLLESGTNGAISMEDTLGAGAVCEYLKEFGYTPVNDITKIARRLFQSAAGNLPCVLRETQGGLNNIKVGLDADIDFAAQLNVYDIVGRVDTKDLVIRPIQASS